MTAHLPALIVVIPLMAGLVISAVGWIQRKLCFGLAVATLVLTFGISIELLMTVVNQGVIDYRLGGWAPPWGILYRIDPLNAVLIAVIYFVATVNLIASKPTIDNEIQEMTGPYYALYVLFVTGLSGIVATGDAFNLYVLLEISSLTGYALIGLGNDRAAFSSLHYLFMGTIGASFYLLGVGYLYLATGTLNMADLARLVPELAASPVILLAFVLCLGGLFVKMALFPLHGWLPNAYTFAPSASASLIAPLTTKVMIYVMIRIVLSVFTPHFAFEATHISGFVVWGAVIAIVLASLSALAQTRLKRMLTYILVAEVGYMVGGFWLGNQAGMTGAMLHIINDAVMTLCMFIFAGAITLQLCEDDFKSLRGVFRRMPYTMIAFVIGALSMIGVPPTCGFFSKWYLISGGLAAGQYGFVAALILSSLINVVLFFRIIEIGYFEPFDEHGHGGHGHIPRMEAPLPMVAALLLVAVSLVFLGLYTGDIVTHVISKMLPGGLMS